MSNKRRSEHRLGLRQPGHLGGIEFEGQKTLPAARRIAAPEIGPRRRLNEREVLSQHAILGQVVDGFERGLDAAYLLGGARADARAPCGIEAQLEQLDELARDFAVRGKGALDEGL